MSDDLRKLAEASLTKSGAEFNECDLTALARGHLDLLDRVERLERVARRVSVGGCYPACEHDCLACQARAALEVDRG